MKKFLLLLSLFAMFGLLIGCSKDKEADSLEQEPVVEENPVVDEKKDTPKETGNTGVQDETPYDYSRLLNDEQINYFIDYYTGRDPKEGELKGTTPTDIFLLYWHAIDVDNTQMEYALTYHDEQSLDYNQYVTYSETIKKARASILEDIVAKNSLDEKIDEEGNKATITVKTNTDSGEVEHVYELIKNQNDIWKVVLKK